MSITLLLTLFALVATAILGRKFLRLPNNVWLLFLAQPLAMASSSMVVLAGGLLAIKIAPTPELATLPLTLMILGTAAGVIPASLLMKKLGRKKGTMSGLLLAIFGAIFCMFAATKSAFGLLLIGATLLGASLAFVAQMRFAAMESLDDISDSAKAVSVLMVGGIFAAVLGPEVAVVARDWIASPFGFAGSFLVLAIMIALAIFLLGFLAPIKVMQTKAYSKARPLAQIVRQPIFLIALSSGVIAYVVMSYIMTATPLSMHELQGHDLEHTKWVIQSHIVAMYLPSLISALLIRYIGIARLLLCGAITYVLVVWIALSGEQVMHYWWAMVLLGVGWNFLFTGGTLLLPESYQTHERFKVQALNDFTIFFVQALASLLAGIILFSQGWSILILYALPLIVIMLAVSFCYLFFGGREGQL